MDLGELILIIAIVDGPVVALLYFLSGVYDKYLGR